MFVIELCPTNVLDYNTSKLATTPYYNVYNFLLYPIVYISIYTNINLLYLFLSSSIILNLYAMRPIKFFVRLFFYMFILSSFTKSFYFLLANVIGQIRYTRYTFTKFQLVSAKRYKNIQNWEVTYTIQTFYQYLYVLKTTSISVL